MIECEQCKATHPSSSYKKASLSHRSRYERGRMKRWHVVSREGRQTAYKPGSVQGISPWAIIHLVSREGRQTAYKPGSVQGISPWAIIHLGLRLPAASSNQPEQWR